MSHARSRTWAVAGLAVLTLVGTGGASVADDVSNDLDPSIDATAEVMSLNVGGADGTTTLYVQPRNGDGKSGCNLTGGSALGVAVSTSDPAVATVSLDTPTFTSCGDARTVTVHPEGTGTATISVSQTSNSTGGTFNLAPATFTVEVSGAANTAPTISVEGVDPGASYAKGSVPLASCAVSDAEDGPSTFPAILSGRLDADGLGAQTASCSYTDTGGLEVSATETYSIVDATAPSVTYTLDPADPDGDEGWYRGDVTLTWHVSDPESPSSLDTDGCADQAVTADQHATAYSCSATSSGGETGPVTVTVKRDGNGPVVSYDGVSGTEGNAGWYVSPVTATFTATDAFSGVAGSDSGTTTSTGDGAAVVLDSPAFHDRAGNTTPSGAAQSPALKIDTTAPDAPTYVGGPADGSSQYFGSVPDVATCVSHDATSGLASCLVTGHGTAVGTHTLTATATDNAGNTSQATRTYTVLPWTMSGFYKPVDTGGVLNTVKAGSTVPLKFELFAGPSELTDIAAVSSFRAERISCSGTAETDAVEFTTTGGTSLRYDSTDGQYIQNWKVPTGGGQCYRVTMTAQDGSTIKALFKTK